MGYYCEKCSSPSGLYGCSENGNFIHCAKCGKVLEDKIDVIKKICEIKGYGTNIVTDCLNYMALNNKTTICFYHDGTVNIPNLDDYIAKKYNKMKKTVEYRATREQMSSIFNVACPTWRDKIDKIVMDSFSIYSDTAVIAHGIVDEMFQASDVKQRDILDKIFP